MTTTTNLVNLKSAFNNFRAQTPTLLAKALSDSENHSSVPPVLRITRTSVKSQHKRLIPVSVHWNYSLRIGRRIFVHNHRSVDRRTCGPVLDKNSARIERWFRSERSSEDWSMPSILTLRHSTLISTGSCIDQLFIGHYRRFVAASLLL